MKILLISHFFPPKHNAGTENYTFCISKALLARSHDVQVLCTEGWDIGGSYWNGVVREFHQSIPVTRIHLNWNKADDPNRVLYDSGEVNKWLETFLEKEKFDIVHITSANTFGAGILLKIQQAGIPSILTLMDFWFLCPSVQLLRSDGSLCDGRTTPLECQACLMASSGLADKLGQHGNLHAFNNKFLESLAGLQFLANLRWFRGKLLNMSERKKYLINALEIPDIILSHSKFVKKMFSKHVDLPIRVLRNGHELSWMEKYHGKTRSDKLRFGYVGQIIPIKGVHILIEAFNNKAITGNSKLNIWGDLTRDTSYVETLRLLIGNNPSISLCGRFEHDDLAIVLSDIDVLVVPSTWYENAPLVIQEALCYKNPRNCDKSWRNGRSSHSQCEWFII
jgi:glycosyltransferase involved in cell wall biosynthesis